jgi:hypothetical protein
MLCACFLHGMSKLLGADGTVARYANCEGTASNVILGPTTSPTPPKATSAKCTECTASSTAPARRAAQVGACQREGRGTLLPGLGCCAPHGARASSPSRAIRWLGRPAAALRWGRDDAVGCAVRPRSRTVVFLVAVPRWSTRQRSPPHGTPPLYRAHIVTPHGAPSAPCAELGARGWRGPTTGPLDECSFFILRTNPGPPHLAMAVTTAVPISAACHRCGWRWSWRQRCRL